MQDKNKIKFDKLNWSNEKDIPKSILVLDLKILKHEIDNKVSSKKQEALKKLKTALTTVGGLYIKNHGLPDNVIENVLNLTKDFFSKTLEEKESINKHAIFLPRFTKLGAESTDNTLNGGTDVDLCRKFTWNGEDKFPNDDMKKAYIKYRDKAMEATLTLIKGILLTLGVDEKHKAYKEYLGDGSLLPVFRFLDYPDIDKVDKSLSTGKTRMGEHSDHDFVTLLFQTPTKSGFNSLRVETGKGTNKFIPVPAVRNLIFANIGTTTQYISEKVDKKSRYVAARHRVDMTENKKGGGREVITMFCMTKKAAEKLLGGGFPTAKSYNAVNKAYKQVYQNKKI